jgi:hypothetical protein
MLQVLLVYEMKEPFQAAVFKDGERRLILTATPSITRDPAHGQLEYWRYVT